MFKHNLKYSLKILLKNKSLIFWTFVFPILLGTLFKMAFSNIENSETLKIIDIVPRRLWREPECRSGKES